MNSSINENKVNIFSRRTLIGKAIALAAGITFIPDKLTRSNLLSNSNDELNINIIKNRFNIDKFINDNFLLDNKFAELLYHEYAKGLPIIDYHNHLPPAQIAENKKFKDLTEVWLDGDHYKWRAMRANGVDEKYITGNASNYDKFFKWAETVPYTMRNPLYHWTHLELRRYFGITKILNTSTAREIYDEATALLQTERFSVQNMLKDRNVEVLCTTDDPIDDLRYHQDIKKQGYSVKVLPAWRPDRVMAANNPKEYNKYLDKLSAASEVSITTFQDLIEALRNRQSYFHTNGCRLTDHGSEKFYAEEYNESEIENIFSNVRKGINLSEIELNKLRSALLVQFGEMNHEYGWTQQFHVGPIRNNNTKMFNEIGPDTGYDSIGDLVTARPMSKYLNRLNVKDKLTKTIVYNINPKDNELMATMIGNFNDGVVPGKMQFGSAWWFLDQKDGIEKQLNSLSNMSLLRRFVGMTTDSRSFLSYPRHEYFRRVLCNLIGKDVEKGELPEDIELLGKTVQDICYYNAKEYFNFS